MKRLRRIDKVRASRDGHEFHEAWAARKALRLVVQLDGLAGIAVEGLAPLDQQGVSDETVEIADLVLYYGKSPTFDAAESVAIIQFKYSKSLAGVPYRASEIKKTIRKFAQAYRSYKKKHGTKEVDEKLSFELIRNCTGTTRKEGGAEPCQGGPLPRVDSEARGIRRRRGVLSLHKSTF
jgi:hypothetical protein